MMNAMGSPMNSSQLSAFWEGVLAMGDAVAKLGWCLGAMLILLMLAAWKKVEESARSHSESFAEAALCTWKARMAGAQ